MNKFKLQALIAKAKQQHEEKKLRDAAEAAAKEAEKNPPLELDVQRPEVEILPDSAMVESVELEASPEVVDQLEQAALLRTESKQEEEGIQASPKELEAVTEIQFPTDKIEIPKSALVSSLPSRNTSASSNHSNHQVTHIPATTGKVFTETGSFHPVIPGFEYNEKQLLAIELAMRGKSINLIGAAGTGKTTTTREIIGQVVKLPQCTTIHHSTKYLDAGSPGVVIISFTNKAVNNIKRFLPDELKRHCLTIHSLLEFKPIRSFDDVELSQRNAQGNFLPTYYEDNKLPHIPIVIVEESSMVGWDDHWKWVIDALPHPEETQFIFLGDLNQLPPIFGPSVLGFKLLELSTVELTHVYRQALESPIITLAHKIREGRVIGPLKPVHDDGTGGFLDDRAEHGKVTIHPWKKKLQPVSGCKTVQNFVTKLHETGQYDPAEDIILCPFNKTFGTIELNKGIADYLGKLREATVYEVCSRGMFSYWAVGDRVLVDRQEAIITKIEETPHYSGRQPDEPSKTMNRWGKDPKKKRAAKEDDEDKDILIARGHDVLSTLEIGGEESEGKNTASHTITVEFCDTGMSRVLSSSGDVNAMVFAYALTVHKSQGSEWRKVFIFLHYSHNTMLTRELMYTAVTRAKQELFIICEPDRGEVFNSLTRAAKSPEITGVTLAEKAEYFKAKKKTMQRLADREAKQQELQSMEEDNYEDMDGEESSTEIKETKKKLVAAGKKAVSKIKAAIKSAEA